MSWYKIEYYDNDGNSTVYGYSDLSLEQITSDNVEPNFVKLINCCYYSSNEKRYVSLSSWDKVNQNVTSIRRTYIIRVDILSGDPTLSYAEGERFESNEEPFELNVSDKFTEKEYKKINSLIPKIGTIRESFSKDHNVEVPRLRVRDDASLRENEYVFSMYGNVVARGRFEYNDFEEYILKELQHVLKMHSEKFR